MSFGKRIIGIIKNTGKSLFSKDSLGFLVFMYALGIVESYAVLSNWKGAKVYGNLYYELFLDLLVLTFLIALVPKKIRKFPLRATVRGIIYAIAYSLAIIDTFCMVQFGNTISPSMLLLVGETTGNETTEFLSTYVNLDVMFTTKLGCISAFVLCLSAVSIRIQPFRISPCDCRLERYYHKQEVYGSPLQLPNRRRC